MKELSQEEIIYRNVESYLRAAIIELVNIEGSNLDIVNCLANTIGTMKYVCKERQMISEANKCGL